MTSQLHSITPNELRARIIETTRVTGGHLASSLGAVEIALALVRVFDPQKDYIVWDVGHQAYAWKLLTGRSEKFSTLRQWQGLSGFPHPFESPADVAVAGHAGVALSVAEGLAAGAENMPARVHVVAVVGDGALANGTALESLTRCKAACRKVILLVNDNHSDGLAGTMLNAAFFEQFGFRYHGPIDGHDLAALTTVLTDAKAETGSVVLHVRTIKGKGYSPAETDPAAYHSISPATAPKDGPSWSAGMVASLMRLAQADRNICALTAGMKEGTGLTPFAEAFPTRFYDVGIAEGHLVAYAAGLAACGLRPVVVVYSTFLQRAIDQVMHDVCIARVPVVFCVDRAGIVGADGVTHQGLYDLAMLKCLPNLTICQPKDAADLDALLCEAVQRMGPTIIRYPRGAMPEPIAYTPPKVPRFALWSTGDWYARACRVAERLGGVAVHARYLKPLDTTLLAAQREAGLPIVSLENACLMGGLGESLGADVRFGWPDVFIAQGTPEELERAYGLDEEGLVRTLSNKLAHVIF